MYQPPFEITNQMIDGVAEIAELIGKLDLDHRLTSNPTLRRSNRIRTIHGSLAIEQNALSLEQVTAVLNGKHVSHMDMSKWTDNKVGPDGTVIPPWLTKQKKCDMPTKGKVGLQGKHGGAATDFRNIKIRPIQK